MPPDVRLVAPEPLPKEVFPYRLSLLMGGAQRIRLPGRHDLPALETYICQLLAIHTTAYGRRLGGWVDLMDTFPQKKAVKF